jgi:hypothetical protein
MPVRLSVFLHGTTQLPLVGFLSNSALGVLIKFVENVTNTIQYITVREDRAL